MRCILFSFFLCYETKKEFIACWNVSHWKCSKVKSEKTKNILFIFLGTFFFCKRRGGAGESKLYDNSLVLFHHFILIFYCISVNRIMSWGFGTLSKLPVIMWPVSTIIFMIITFVKKHQWQNPLDLVLVMVVHNDPLFFFVCLFVCFLKTKCKVSWIFMHYLQVEIIPTQSWCGTRDVYFSIASVMMVFLSFGSVFWNIWSCILPVLKMFEYFSCAHHVVVFLWLQWKDDDVSSRLFIMYILVIAFINWFVCLFVFLSQMQN